MLARSLPLLMILTVLATGCLKTEFVTAADGGDSAGVDAALADAGTDTIGDGAAPGTDASVDSADGITSSDVEVDAGCGGAAGCPCSAANDCLGGFCVNYAEGSRCAAPCTGSCPAGLTCTPADGGASLCTDPWAHLCAPCQTSSSCQDLGNAEGTCADLTNSAGVQGWFCTRNCADDKDCPAGHACIERAVLNAASAKVCAPISGQCACSGLAIQTGASTTCGTSGTCPGTRTCKATGMGPCEVPAAVTETCNGVDDDCNGETDENSTGCDDGNPCSLDGCSGGKCIHLPGAGTCVDSDPCTEDEACVGTGCVGKPTVCDDNNPCTADSCDPIEGCVGKATAGGCNDANACTTGEACQDGQCLGGQTVGCDDANVCTDDACDPVSGCVHMPNVTGCSDANACTSGDLCGDGVCKTTAIVCDDGTGCTLDACDAQKGCVFTAGADKDCGTANLPYTAALSCGDVAFAGWKVTPGAGADVAGKPAVRWALDALPVVDVTQPDACSLNVNDGQHLQCAPGQNPLVVTADSPRIDASALSPNAPLVLRLQSAGQWGAGWKAEVLYSTDEVNWNLLSALPPTGSLWGKVQQGVGQLAGHKVRLRLRFSGDCGDPSGTGWFIRQVSLQLDPCTVGNGGCGFYATCAPNPDGSAKCTCSPGFFGDGITCTDIDECTTGNGGCAGKCTNSTGGFSCGCKPGYAGDGSLCTDIDECAVNNGGCDVNAQCTNTPGSFACACKPGFSGDGKTCGDVDECAKGIATCDKNATCANTAGSYTCTCKTGYSGSGKTCTDVNECAGSTPVCDTNAICGNTVGSYSCTCKPGFSVVPVSQGGNGAQCLPYGTSVNPATSCLAILKNKPTAATGTYTLKLAGSLVNVQCDMTTEGGGWTRIDYAQDLVFKQQFFSSLGWQWLPTNFQTVLKPAQIAALQAVSTEGKQTYVGQCAKVYHWASNKYGYTYAFGFRFLDGTETSHGLATWPGFDIVVGQDDCKSGIYGGSSLVTVFTLHGKKLPVVNVSSRDAGLIGAKFGSPLTQNPAWLR